MRELFPGYYRPSDETFKALWDECVFVFDANVLLNVYRYSPKTLKNFLNILEKLQERLWLPHQAAYEYQENRLNVISAQHQPYEDIPKLLNELIARIGTNYPRHPFINTNKINRLLTQTRNSIEKELDLSKQQHRDLISNDDLRDKLDSIFNTRVGNPYDDNRLKALYGEAEKRYQNNIPPGYKDNKKTETRKYGDVIVWFQIKDYAGSIKKPILLVTDDRKDDWWLVHKGKTIGPRPELIQEIRGECGVDFYMYESDKFISYAQEYLKLNDKEAVSEAREVKQYEQEIRRRMRFDSLDYSAGYFQHKDKDVYKTEQEIIEFIAFNRPEGTTIEEITQYFKKPRRLVAEAMTDLAHRGILVITSTQPDVVYAMSKFVGHS